jgi:hypothetical protein
MAMMNFIHAPFAAFSPGDTPAEHFKQAPCQMRGALESGEIFSQLRKTPDIARSNLVQILMPA